MNEENKDVIRVAFPDGEVVVCVDDAELEQLGRGRVADDRKYRAHRRFVGAVDALEDIERVVALMERQAEQWEELADAAEQAVADEMDTRVEEPCDEATI